MQPASIFACFKSYSREINIIRYFSVAVKLFAHANTIPWGRRGACALFVKVVTLAYFTIAKWLTRFSTFQTACTGICLQCVRTCVITAKYLCTKILSACRQQVVAKPLRLELVLQFLFVIIKLKIITFRPNFPEAGCRSRLLKTVEIKWQFWEKNRI